MREFVLVCDCRRRRRCRNKSRIERVGRPLQASRGYLFLFIVRGRAFNKKWRSKGWEKRESESAQQQPSANAIIIISTFWRLVSRRRGRVITTHALHMMLRRVNLEHTSTHTARQLLNNATHTSSPSFRNTNPNNYLRFVKRETKRERWETLWPHTWLVVVKRTLRRSRHIQVCSVNSAVLFLNRVDGAMIKATRRQKTIT